MRRFRRLLVGPLLLLLVGGSALLLAQRQPTATPPRSERPTALCPVPDVSLRTLARQAGLRTAPVPGARLLVHKAALTLDFYGGDRLLKTYPIARGFGDLADKVQRDDGRTPEGEFRIVQRVRQAQLTSWQDIWMRLDYPLPEDAERGLAAGLIDRRQYRAILSAHRRGVTPPQNTALGSGVGIHIGGPEPRQWTQGCLALRDVDGAEIYEQVRIGTKVTIKP